MKHYRGETKCTNCGRTIYDMFGYTKEPHDEDHILCGECAERGMYYYPLYCRHYKCEKCGRPSFSNTAYVSLREKFCSECGGQMVEYEL